MAKRTIVAVSYELPVNRVWATVQVESLEGEVRRETFELQDSALLARAAKDIPWGDMEVVAELDAIAPLPLVEVRNGEIWVTRDGSETKVDPTPETRPATADQLGVA